MKEKDLPDHKLCPSCEMYVLSNCKSQHGCPMPDIYKNKILTATEASPQPPAQRKPLTDEDIVIKARAIGGLFDDLAIGYQTDDIIRLGREVEAAHGIKENT